MSDKYELAFNEWHEKTEWVLTDKRFDVLLPWGKHRADVLKEYIDHLENKLEASEKRIAELEGREVNLPDVEKWRPVDAVRSQSAYKILIAAEIRAAGIKIKGE